MKKKNFYIFSLSGLVLFLVISFYAFKSSLTPYVSFKEARELKKTVQIAGVLERNSINYSKESRELQFIMKEKDKNDLMKISYFGPKPLNFEDAESIVAIGSYEGNLFKAKEILVKCPSKYQGTETERRYK